jgi:hypothetical protein
MTTSMRKRRRWATRFRPRFLSLVAAGLLLVPPAATAQELTGALVVIVNDTQGGVVVGAVVRVSWPALIGGSIAFTTTETGRLRFQALPRGCYALDIDFPGFIHYHKDIRLAAGVTFEIRAVLSVAGPEQSVDVQGVGARVEARNPGFASVWGPEHQEMIPTRRASMFDLALSLAAVPDGPARAAAFNTATSSHKRCTRAGSATTCWCPVRSMSLALHPAYTRSLRRVPRNRSIRTLLIGSPLRSQPRRSFAGKVLRRSPRSGTHGISSRFRLSASLRARIDPPPTTRRRGGTRNWRRSSSIELPARRRPPMAGTCCRTRGFSRF